MKILNGFCIAFLFLSGCGPSGDSAGRRQDTTSAKQSDSAAVSAVRDAGERFVEAYNSGDLEALGRFFAEDAVLMPPNSPEVSGREAIQEFYRGIMATTTANLQVTREETRVSGEWAFGRGTGRLSLTPRDGGSPIEQNFKYLVLLNKAADGDWKIARHIWNTSSALPAPPPMAPRQ